jgi:hypothetical protein
MKDGGLMRNKILAYYATKKEGFNYIARWKVRKSIFRENAKLSGPGENFDYWRCTAKLDA